jgi:hypothetical protein
VRWTDGKNKKSAKYGVKKAPQAPLKLKLLVNMRVGFFGGLFDVQGCM